MVRLNNDDILFIESMGDYVKFVTSDKKYITHNTIKNLEEKVNRQCFIKVHRSYIININKIDDIRENDLYIKGNEIPVSKAHKADVLKRLNIIWFFSSTESLCLTAFPPQITNNFSDTGYRDHICVNE